MKKKIYIDFDGVLNTYTGWKDGELFEPKEGVKDFLKELSKKYEIYIFSTRNPLDIADWLTEHNIKQYVSNITNVKAPAHAYIDDRAIKFDGDYAETIIELEKFRPYWQK